MLSKSQLFTVLERPHHANIRLAARNTDCEQRVRRVTSQA